jgi:hypothetical protein
LKTIIMTSLLLAALSARGDSLVNPHFRTDRSVDSRSARTSVRDLIRPGMTNEEKALALFHWVRRVIFHSGPEEPMRHDFNKMINVFGYGSCYMQTHPLSHLFQQLGFPCRNWVHNTHHMMEVYYDGAWHCFDPHMTFFVYNRAIPRSIASVAELRADATLAGAAVKEKRTGPAFLICGDAPTWFSGDTGWTLDHPFLPHNGADEEFGDITLRRGERYVRTWKAGKYLRDHAFLDKFAPYHTCGLESDRRDPVNFPFWEPYAWRDREAASHRHAGSGFLEYAPDLRSGGWRDGALRIINLVNSSEAGTAALHPAAGGIESEVIFTVRSPYVLTDASLDLSGRIGRSEDRIKISVSRRWVGADRDWKEVCHFSDSGPFQKQIDLSPFIEGSLDGYWIRIVMKAKDARRTGLDSLRIRSDFQLNPYALPQLLPGENRLFVTAARSERPWRFKLSWREGPDWTIPRDFTAAVTGLSHEALVQAAGPKFPRMESIEFSVDP